MQPHPKLLLAFLKTIFWFVFIGLCINTGALLISFLISLVDNPLSAKRLPLGLDLLGLYQFNTTSYGLYVSLLIASSALKAFLTYLLVKALGKFDFERPFQAEAAVLLVRMSQVALLEGLVLLVVAGYSTWLLQRGGPVPSAAGSAEWLFLASVIFVLAQVFRRGVEFQAEHELTV